MPDAPAGASECADCGGTFVGAGERCLSCAGHGDEADGRCSECDTRFRVSLIGLPDAAAAHCPRCGALLDDAE